MSDKEFNSYMSVPPLIIPQAYSGKLGNDDNDVKNNLFDESVTPSPTFDFPSFMNFSLDKNKQDDNSSLISFDAQCVYLTSDDNNDICRGGSLSSTTTTAYQIDTNDYHGFTLQGSNILTIPCNTGDLSSDH
ncbi:hypothetical protein HCN44_008832 [Aphidius gifuensis]|uniref:Uncharacterized protein n=1 Tax=Aphidius gifuensis TaxID=684658 RepID=A0A834Y5M5_APHGI|nr:hypothetical protein HCN44_008832 [Aphidius gifuensis]